MSKPSQHGQQFDTNDALSEVLDTAARIAFWGGLGAIVLSVAFLMVAVFYTGTGTDSTKIAGDALRNIDILSKVLLAGVVIGGLGSAFLFWGEETLSVAQLALAAALFFSPFYMPMLLGRDASFVGQKALAAISSGGSILGFIAIVILVAELSIRVTARAKKGVKADSLKFGKGIKEETRQNKFMGKCWQLPFCRQFVRERCPIYHAKRTCWKERVGCMCEEEVIRNAMENRAIPKDAVAAGRYIPVNNRLTMSQKRDRCRQCVIFNEHLKQKYRLSLPLTIIGFGLFYLVARQPLLNLSGHMISMLNGGMKQLTMGNSEDINSALKNGPFQEVLLDCFMVALFAYVLKGLEYVIFKLKV